MNLVDTSGWLEYFFYLIYSSALAHGATLWTQDDHFSNLPNVRYVEA